MLHKTYMVIKESDHNSDDSVKVNTLNKLRLNNITNDTKEQLQKEVKEYIEKNGYHFNDTLAEFASKQMVNANGQKHSWSVERVKSLFSTHGLELPKETTWGDMTYLANMCYADIYPEVAKDEVSCIKYAHLVGNDPDGYEGMIFKRWCTDMIGKHLNVDWIKYL